jgi:hypothetical protein
VECAAAWSEQPAEELRASFRCALPAVRSLLAWKTKATIVGLPIF